MNFLKDDESYISICIQYEVRLAKLKSEITDGKLPQFLVLSCADAVLASHTHPNIRLIHH